MSDKQQQAASTTPSGSSAALRRLPIGKADLKHDRAVTAFRRMLEAALIEAKGEVREQDAVLVWAATRAFRRAQRIERRMRFDGEAWTVDQWLNAMGKATALEESVVRHVRNLGLTRSAAADLLAELYRRQLPAACRDPATPPPLDAPEPPSAADQPEAVGGEGLAEESGQG